MAKELSDLENALARHILVEWEQKCGEPSIATYHPYGDKIVGEIELCAFYEGDEKAVLEMKKTQLGIMAEWLQANYQESWTHALDVTYSKEAHVRLALECAAVAKHFNSGGIKKE